MGAGLCGAGRSRAECVGVGAVSARAGWGRGRVEALHCRVSVGGRRGVRCCCAGGVRVGRSRGARRGGGLRPSSRRRARVQAGVSRGVACGRRGELTCWSDCLQCVCACVCVWSHACDACDNRMHWIHRAVTTALHTAPALQRCFWTRGRAVPDMGLPVLCYCVLVKRAGFPIEIRSA